LEDYHVRSERFIHYSSDWPALVYRHLENSFLAHSQSAGASRYVAVTPGSPGPAYLAIIAAATASGAYFVTESTSIPFTGDETPAGTVILRIRG
jgi:hypothetical protein